MHVIGGVGGAFHLGDLQFALDLAHGDDGLDEVDADIVGHLINITAEPFGTLDLRVGTIGRQDMDLTALGDGLLKVFTKFVEVAAVGDADAVALFLQRGQGTAPDDIVDGDFDAEENLIARLKVDDTNQVGMVEAEVIGEVAVLAVDIGVVGIVEGGLVVGREEGDALRNHFLQGGATATINVFIEHNG